jgi:ABC-2 type transport system ATP-binding protein
VSIPAVEAIDLVKRFGDNVAVDRVSFAVRQGSVLGLLGPNGAGKTTTVRMLTTLSVPTSGTGRVAGHDVVTEPDAVRHSMGLTGQAATVDELLTARENLAMIGRLAGMPRRSIRAVGDDLLERFLLADAADRVVKTYSGGMRRRLDLAVSLIAAPPVLFLDEPTTGLDPRSRTDMWEVIQSLVAGGTSLLLTTQYLEEADLLADEIVVIDHGRVIAQGTADQLKAQVGGERLSITVSHPGTLALAHELVQPLGVGPATVEEHRRSLLMPVSGGAAVLVDALRRLDAASIALDDVGLRRPTLDDVFLTLTGHAAEDTPTDPEAVPAEEMSR